MAWVVDYLDQDEKRRHRTFKTQKAAKTWWETDAAGNVAKGTHTPDSTSITVKEAGKRWIDQAKQDGLERSTVTQYRQHLDLHINQLDVCHRGIITRTITALQDTDITSSPFPEPFTQIIEQLADNLPVTQPRKRQPPVCQGGLLAQRDHGFDISPQFLRLGDGGLDLLMPQQ